MVASIGRTVGRLADRTPPDRDRVVDAVRALSICVVVVWHWTLSINHRDDDGRLVNPNPIADVPLGWLPTWVLQIMPLFFIVGGFANCAGWRSTVRDGGGALDFLRARARRLLAPVAVFLAVWIVIDVTGRLVVDGYRSVVDVAFIVFMPVWFVGAYIWVVALSPLTATLHRTRPFATVIALAAVVAAADVARFGLGLDEARWVNVALVWVVIHQLGYFWADGTATGWTSRQASGLAALGLVGLAVLTTLDAYPRSMVATADDDISHMYPPTAVLVVLAATQLGIIMALRPRLAGWLKRRRPWTVVVGINAVIMTIFLWHMAALLLMIWAYEALGGTLGDEPTVGWWLARPLWLIGPALTLVPLVAVFAIVEAGRRQRT